VARKLADAFLRLVVEDEYLLVASSPQNGPGDRRVAEEWRADLWLTLSLRAREDHAIEGNLGTGLAGYIAADNVTLGDTILFAAGLNDRVHGLGYDTNPAGALSTRVFGLVYRALASSG
jgi:hypothetical protein